MQFSGGANVLNKIKLLKWAIVLLLFVVFGVLFVDHRESEKPAIASTDQETLGGEINKILADTRLQGATTSVSIRHAASGEILYSHLGDTRVHPASVMKLLTGAAALETLGQDYTFKTELLTDGVIKDGVLNGDLFLKGQGDPTLTMKDLNAFVANLKAKGVNTISGNIYGDDTWYDDVRLSQDLNWSDESYYTGAQISALTVSPNDDFDAGTVIVEVSSAAKENQAAIVSMTPANHYMKIVNKAQTVAKNGMNSISVERLHGSNTVVISGTIPKGRVKKRSWVSTWEPTNYAISLLKTALDEQGIQFVSTPKVEQAKVPDGATLLTGKQSMALEELFIPFMKLSNNGHAEVLVKEIGRTLGGEGSWDKGLVVMDEVLTDIGMDTKTTLLRDGSGMSHKTLVTANEVTNLLFAVQTKPWYPIFLNSLPVAGHDDRLIGGTLRNRMKGTRAEGKVKAKTGLLNGAAALSGYAETKDGQTLIFSIMVNNHLDPSISEVIDRIAVMLANYNTEGK